jgi:hypothetical protein
MSSSINDFTLSGYFSDCCGAECYGDSQEDCICAECAEHCTGIPYPDDEEEDDD